MIDLDALAGLFYTSWWKEVGGTLSGGDDIPTWETFRNDPKKSTQSNAWIEVARLATVKISQSVEGVKEGKMG